MYILEMRQKVILRLKLVQYNLVFIPLCQPNSFYLMLQHFVEIVPRDCNLVIFIKVVLLLSLFFTDPDEAINFLEKTKEKVRLYVVHLVHAYTNVTNAACVCMISTLCY